MTRTPLAIVIGALVLLAASLIALTLGARPIAAGEWLAILHEGRGNEAAEIVLGLRLPRVLLGAMVGAALGLAGAVIQLATRNPLGDPGLLGINAGASLALILGTDLIGLAGPQAATWLAACGALSAVLAVQALAGARSSSNPIRLTLAGVAVTALCIGIGQAVALSDPERFDLVRNWRIGALSGAIDAVLPSVTLAWLVGTLLALALAPASTFSRLETTARPRSASRSGRCDLARSSPSSCSPAAPSQRPALSLSSASPARMSPAASAASARRRICPSPASSAPPSS